MEDDLTCCICLDLFRDPRSLPCGHIFCNECITAFSKRSSVSFQCPVCQNDTRIGYPGLPRMHAIRNLVEEFKLRRNAVLTQVSEVAQTRCCKVAVQQRVAIQRQRADLNHAEAVGSINRPREFWNTCIAALSSELCTRFLVFMGIAMTSYIVFRLCTGVTITSLGFQLFSYPLYWIGESVTLVISSLVHVLVWTCLRLFVYITVPALVTMAMFYWFT